MDPTHLNSEELDYELLIRGQLREVTNQPRAKTRLLSELLRQEKNNARMLPGMNASPFTPEQDISMCTKICVELNEQIERTPMNMEQKMRALSRVIHAGQRMLRIQVSDSVLKDRLHKCLHLLKGLEEILERNHTDRAATQRRSTGVSFAPRPDHLDEGQASTSDLQTLLDEATGLQVASGAIPRTSYDLPINLPVRQCIIPLRRIPMAPSAIDSILQSSNTLIDPPPLLTNNSVQQTNLLALNTGRYGHDITDHAINPSGFLQGSSVSTIHNDGQNTNNQQQEQASYLNDNIVPRMENLSFEEIRLLDTTPHFQPQVQRIDSLSANNVAGRNVSAMNEPMVDSSASHVSRVELNNALVQMQANEASSLSATNQTEIHSNRNITNAIIARMIANQGEQNMVHANAYEPMIQNAHALDNRFIGPAVDPAFNTRSMPFLQQQQSAHTLNNRFIDPAVDPAFNARSMPFWQPPQNAPTMDNGFVEPVFNAQNMPFWQQQNVNLNQHNLNVPIRYYGINQNNQAMPNNTHRTLLRVQRQYTIGIQFSAVMIPIQNNQICTSFWLKLK